MCQESISFTEEEIGAYHHSRQGLRIFLFTIALGLVLGPIHPIQWVTEALFLEVKRPGREVDHSPASGAIPPPPICFHGMVFC